MAINKDGNFSEVHNKVELLRPSKQAGLDPDGLPLYEVTGTEYPVLIYVLELSGLSRFKPGRG